MLIVLSKSTALKISNYLESFSHEHCFGGEEAKNLNNYIKKLRGEL